MEFKAEMIDGNLQVKAVIERVGSDVIVHVPSFPLMSKLKEEHEKQNGKRNIQ